MQQTRLSNKTDKRNHSIHFNIFKGKGRIATKSNVTRNILNTAVDIVDQVVSRLNNACLQATESPPVPRHSNELVWASSAHTGWRLLLLWLLLEWILQESPLKRRVARHFRSRGPCFPHTDRRVSTRAVDTRRACTTSGPVVSLSGKKTNAQLPVCWTHFQS